MRRTFTAAFLLLFAFATAQTQAPIDSLRRATHGTNDSLCADAYLRLGRMYAVQFNWQDSLVSNSRMALVIAERSHNAAQLYMAKKQIAGGYVQGRDSANAMVALNAALQEAEHSKDSTHIAEVLHMYGTMYANQGRNEVALEYFTREAETALAAKYYNATAIAYSTIAWIYRGLSQNDKMLKYHRKALHIVDKMEPTIIGNIIQVYVMASQSYLSIGERYKDTVLVDSAKVLADSALALALRHERPAAQASAYYVYAYYALFHLDYEKAEANALKALEYRHVTEKRSQLAMYFVLAVSNAHLGNAPAALLYLDSAKHSPALSEQYYRRHLAEAEWQVYSLLGNYEAAFEAHVRYTAITDSLDNVDTRRSIDEIEQKFNKAENEREIQRLGSEREITSLSNKLLTAGIAAAVLFALIVVLIARQRYLKQKQQQLLIEQRLNRARMDPHFLFNTFTALQGLVLKEKDPLKAADYLSDYSTIMRQTLESTFAELITLEEEIAYLEKYLSLQQMRLSKKFSYSIHCDAAIDPMDTMIPAMIVQPFVENSIEHAFGAMGSGGELNIRFSLENNELSITITDNGPGFSPARSEKTYPSRATAITADRLLLLNKKYGSNARYTIRSSSPGVVVSIHLPQLK